MPRSILLLAIVATLAFASCTTAYKSGQTPDDVYYSPTPQREEYVRVDQDDDRTYRYDDEYYDDRYLRMKVRNRYRWDELNDWYYYDRYSYGYNYYYGTWNNPYNSWHYYNNPYYCCCNHNNTPKGIVSVNNFVKPRNFNVGSYTNTNLSNSNRGVNIKSSRPVIGRPAYNNTNSNSNSGRISNTVKRLLNSNSSDDNNSNSNSNSNNRSYNPSSSSSNSSGSGSSGGSSGGGVSRPSRGGN